MENIKVNKIAEQMAGTTLQWSIGLYQAVFKGIETTVFPWHEVSGACVQKGITDIRHLDKEYKTTTIENWKRVVDSTYIHRIKYIAEHIDCDNFAKLFASLSIVLLGGVNSCATAYGDYIKNGKTGRHYFNVILTSDKKLYCFEPINYNLTEIKKGEKIIMGGAEYKIYHLIFF